MANIPAGSAPNPYLEGVLAPVHTESTATDLPVLGRLPDFLDGCYLRNGANPVAEVDPATYHWFTGDPMVHGVALRGGEARWYRNRWIRTPAVCAALGESAAKINPRAGMAAVGPNTNVIGHAGRILALVEGGVANYELTGRLDTVGMCDFDGTLLGGYTAHPHRDPSTGELHAVSYSFARANTVQYSVIGTDGRARRTVDIEVAGSPMMHDFSLTEKYVVVYDLPVTFDAATVLPVGMPHWLRTPARLVLDALVGRVRVPSPVTALVNRGTRPPAGLPYRWDPSYPARIGVFPREGPATVRWYDVDPCFVFHPVNAYTTSTACTTSTTSTTLTTGTGSGAAAASGDELLILDVVRYDRVFDVDRRGPGDSPPALDRWTINLDTGSVRVDRRDDMPQEFPKINDSLIGSEYRFAYTIGIDGGLIGDPQAEIDTRVYKHDFVAGSRVAAPLDDDLLVGEVSFVPRPGATAEDDGVLIGFGHDRRSDESRLMVLDAATLEPMAAVPLPQRVPMGFHGNWVPEAEVSCVTVG